MPLRGRIRWRLALTDSPVVVDATVTWLRRELRPAPEAVLGRPVDRIEAVICELRDEAGNSGLGYAANYGLGTRLQFEVVREAAAWVIGRRAADHALIWVEGHQRNAYLGQAGLLAWGIAVLDIALWDLDCRQSKLPLWRRIGPRRDSVPAYHSGGYLNASTDELVGEWARARERGFGAMKIRVGVGPVGVHRDRVRAVREAMGDAPRLMVEASHSLGLDAAIALAKAIEPFDIHWLEEPFGDDDLASYRQLRRATSIPLAMGEHNYYADGLRDVIVSGDIDIVQPDIIRVGGVSQWLTVAEVAAGSGRPIAPHFYREFDVPLACHAPTAVFVEHFDWLDRFFDWQVDLEAGEYRPREVPGFGLSVNPDVDAFVVARQEVRSAAE